MKAPRVDVTRRVRAWTPSTAEMRNWTRAALGRRAAGREIGIRVVGPREIRRLNAHYRHRDTATNVLSFPVPKALPQPLGDLVICAQVLRSEAREQGKSLRAHWAHLVVHGALHLVGYEHGSASDARRMERREIAVLRRLGFANPYRGE